MDAITALSGSGPAYFALLAEAMIEAGILLGLSREISTQLVVQTMFGTAKQLRDEGMHPVELRESRDVARGNDDRGDPGARVGGRTRSVPERDPGGDGARPGAGRRRAVARGAGRRPPRPRRSGGCRCRVARRRRPRRRTRGAGGRPRRRCGVPFGGGPRSRLEQRGRLVGRRACRTAGRRALELPAHAGDAPRPARGRAPRRASRRGRARSGRGGAHGTTPRWRASHSTWR